MAPADRQVFLFHMGLPKTGSTSIQHGLVSLTDELRTRGIWVPYDRALYGARFLNRGAPRGSPQTDGFSYFFDVGNSRSRSTVDWEKTVAQFLGDGDAKTFVVSHENIALAGNRLRKDRMGAIAAQADIRFLVYLRHPLSFISSYCLQLNYGFGQSLPRASLSPVVRYLKMGYAGLLAPFERFGRVEVRNFDTLSKEGRLVPDFFSTIGADDLSEQAGNLKSQVGPRARLNLRCVFMALKYVSASKKQEWFKLRSILLSAGEALEPPMKTSFLPAPIIAGITARWAEDREVLSKRYGVQFDDPKGITPGPDILSFSPEYAAALQEAVAPDLSPSQRDWLEQALTFAGQNLEKVLSGQTKTVSRPRTSKKGDVIMSDDTKVKVEVSKEDAAVLARAMFKAQSKKDDADSGDKVSFKSAKGEMLPLARRTLKILKRQGYALSK